MDKLPARIEVKFAVAVEDVAKAVKGLGLSDPPDEEYTVHFFDRGPVALLGKGLILRVRQGAGFKKGADSTCKIRGKAAAVAAAKFGVNEDKGRKFEGDQNVGGEERPSFSITLEPAPADIGAVLGGTVAPKRAFGIEAEVLLQEAGSAWKDLLAYGPTHARKWKLELPGFKGKITAELWKTGIIELLEVSDKKDRNKAAAFAAALGGHMAGQVGVAQLQGSKTEFALSHLQPFAIPATG